MGTCEDVANVAVVFTVSCTEEKMVRSEECQCTGFVVDVGVRLWGRRCISRSHVCMPTIITTDGETV